VPHYTRAAGHLLPGGPLLCALGRGVAAPVLLLPLFTQQRRRWALSEVRQETFKPAHWGMRRASQVFERRGCTQAQKAARRGGGQGVGQGRQRGGLAEVDDAEGFSDLAT
jgi:hypothetical protein